MKFTVNTNEFKKAIEKMNKVILDKTSIDVLGAVKIEIQNNKMQLQATDLEVNIITSIDAATNGLSIEFLLRDIKTLHNGMKYFKDYEINCDADMEKGKLQLSCGGKKLTQSIGLDVKIFPEPEFFKQTENTNTYSYNTKSLKERFNLVKYACSTNDAKPILTGVHFNNSDMVTIDGFRLAVNTDINFKVDVPFTVTQNTLKLLPELLNENINITVDNKVISFTDENSTFRCRLLEGEYHPYNNSIPRESCDIEINVNDFIENLKYLKTFNSDKKHGKLHPIQWLNSRLIMRNEKGEYESEINITGEFKNPIGLNCDYLIDGLMQFKGKNVKCYVQNNSMVKFQDENNIALVLCVRLDANNNAFTKVEDVA